MDSDGAPANASPAQGNLDSLHMNSGSSSLPASPVAHPRTSPEAPRAATPPAPASSTPVSLPRIRSSPSILPETLSCAVSIEARRNGEPLRKVLRAGIQGLSSSRESASRFFSEDDAQYERAVRALLECEKKVDEETAFPVADSPAKAAYLSRLQPEQLTEREERDFPDIARGAHSLREMHLLLRNKVLQIWLRNPRRHLVVPKVLASLAENDPELAFDQEHLIKIIKFLNRACMINFGDFAVDRPIPPGRQQRHVIVVGAGIAGLAAARQLKHFGFRVDIIEGRNRCGGRIDTWIGNGGRTNVADKGSMLITGIEGNPLYTILQGQMGLKLENVDIRCPIFENDGTPISQDRDEAIENEFEDLMASAVSHYHHHLSHKPEQRFGMGQCLEEVMKIRELEVMVKCNQGKERRTKKLQDLTNLYNTRTDLFHLGRAHVNDYNKAVLHLEFSPSLAKRDVLRQCRERLAQTEREIQDIEVQIFGEEATLPGPGTANDEHHVYVSAEDKHLLHWHMANYDFANALPVEEISVEHWDNEEEIELKGGHFCAPGGLSQLTERLATGLSINYNHCITGISCSSSGVTVTAKSLYSSVPREFTCDAVISTLPLGVLRHSLRHSSIDFQPPLSSERIRSIKALSPGVLNKVILVYNRKFWKARRTIFGFANGNAERRGEFFMFWGLYEQPILVALIAGKAADTLERVNDDKVVAACVQVIQQIFGKGPATTPKETIVTHWSTDEFSRGCYTSVPVGASGADFDILAEPVSIDGIPRLCFAGEHTVRRYPGTMHGAFISGMREATRIADFLNGTDNIY